MAAVGQRGHMDTAPEAVASHVSRDMYVYGILNGL
jgi:hypothetical protein